MLFVSKPVAPPFRDGTKCLVRDIALALERVSPIVMSHAGALPLEQAAGRQGIVPIETASVYRDAGTYAPLMRDHLRALVFLLGRARADLWHFVFAPNPRTSRFGAWLSRFRGITTLQTVASPPRRFEHLERILFGDVVVAQSRWTLDQIREGYARERIPEPRRPRLELVPPPLGPIDKRPPEALERVRRELGISPAAPVFVYPGDLETSGGAEAVAGAVDELVRELPRAIVVFAYRSKSERSDEAARKLEQKLDPAHVRVSGRLDDVLALIQTSTAVLFPVEDLWGKVDLPIVLLEAMALGTPVIALDRGPLADLEGSLRVAPGDGTALVRAAVAVERDAALRRHVVDAQRVGIAQRHAAGVVARAYEDLYFATLDARGQHFYESRR